MGKIKRYVVRMILRHRAKTYIIIGLVALVLGFLSGYHAGKKHMKRKLRREKLMAKVRSLGKDSTEEKPDPDRDCPGS